MERAATFDVFLSHNGKDKPSVTRLAEKLRHNGVRPWLDTWELIPGGRWQDELHDGLEQSRACAYFIGPHGEGNWAREELDAARSRAASDRNFRLFPVLLPGLPDPFDRTTLPPFLGGRTWVDLRPGIDHPDAFQALINAIKGVPPADHAPAGQASEPPYRGLMAFEEKDARFFFGRDADIQQVIEKLKASRFLAVMGPSGSGKSSLVRAGLVPALRRGALPGSETWPIHVLKPGARPIEQLAAELLAAGASGGMQQTVDGLLSDRRTLDMATEQALRGGPDRAVYVIDQAEEIFTLCEDERQRLSFLENLTYAASVPGGKSVVILAMRADFYARCATYPDLAALISSSQHLVGPLTREGLRDAIELPARAVALELEEGLTATILQDIEREPGALPLLEHALLELWRRRRGSMLTLEAYQEAGAVRGAIAKRAESIYSSFTPDEQQIARRALLRLTQPGEGTEDTRRRATLDELVTQQSQTAQVAAVLNELTDARLLTASADEHTGQSWVDISHEALIRGWPRVREWLNEDRGSRVVHRRLSDAAKEWQRLQRDQSELYRGARLAEAEEWRFAHEDELNPLERIFLDRSNELHKRERLSRQRRRAAQVAAAVLVPLLIVSLIGGFVVVRAREDAAQAVVLARLAQQAAQRDREAAEREQLLAAEADEQRRAAVAVGLGFEALDNRDRPDLALLLQVEATRRSEALALDRLLVSQLTGTPHLVRFAGGTPQAVAVSANGSIAAVAFDDRQVRVGHPSTILDTGTLLTGAPPYASQVAVDSTGRHVAAVDSDGITVWSLPDTAPTWHLQSEAPERVAFLADGSIAVADTFGAVELYDLAGTDRGVAVPMLADRPPSFARPVLAPDGSLVARAEDALAAVYRVADGALIGGSSPAVNQDGSVATRRPLAIDQANRLVAVGDPDSLTVFDIASRQPAGPSASGAVDIASAMFLDPSTLVVSSPTNGIGSIDVSTGTLRWMTSPSGAASLAVAGPRGSIISAHPGFGLAVWDLTRNDRFGRADPVAEPTLVVGIFGTPVAATTDGRTRVSVAFDDGPPTVGPPPLGEPPGASAPPIGAPPGASAPPIGGPPGGWGVTVVEVSTGATRSFAVVDPIGSIAITPDSLTVISTDLISGSPGTWDLVARSSENGDEKWRVSIGTGATPIAISADGTSVATVEGGQVILRSTQDASSAARPVGDVSTMTALALAFSPDGTMIAVAGGVGASAGPPVLAPPGTGTTNQAAITVVSFDGSGRGLPIRRIPGSGATAVAFDPSGGSLAVATVGQGTGALSLFDVQSGERVGPIGTGVTLGYLGFTPDGSEIVSAGVATGWMRWPATVDTWQAAACAIAGRELTREEWAQYFGADAYEPSCAAILAKAGG